jgi:hypothetical protein
MYIVFREDIPLVYFRGRSLRRQPRAVVLTPYRALVFVCVCVCANGLHAAMHRYSEVTRTIITEC